MIKVLEVLGIIVLGFICVILLGVLATLVFIAIRYIKELKDTNDFYS